MPADEKIYDNKHPEVTEFLQKKQAMGRRTRTLNEYSRTLQRFFHDIYPDHQPHEITVDHIEEYVLQLDNRDLAHNTKRRYLETLSAFYSWATKRPRYQNIVGDPAAVVLEELPKQHRDRPDCATWKNGKQIIHEMGDPRNKMVATLLAKTGCRISEALNIRMEDLQLDDGFIRLRERKGGKQGVVPVDGETITALERYQFIRPNTDNDHLFLSIRGNPVGREQIRRAVRRAAVAADVMEEGEKRFERKFTPHTYRTVFTSLMRNTGMPDHILRYIRGDAKIKEAMDIYTKIDRDEVRAEYLKRIKSLEL